MTKREPKIDMTWQEFGKILLETEDLDPVYCCLARAEEAGVLDDRMLKHMLLAYWCFYSVGVASYIASSNDYWMTMWKANQAAPRGMERRYFYGKMSSNTIEELIKWEKPELVVENMCAHHTFQEVYDAVIAHRGFGPWMGWKVADMAERVLSYPVDFTDSEIGIYKDPVQAAAFIVFGDKHHPIAMDELHQICIEIENHFKGYAAPPFFDRPVNIQEVETILCKYKAHCYGFYPLGKDTREVTHGMHGWGDLAEDLIKFMPVEE